MPAYPCVREGRALNMLSRVTAKQNVLDFFFFPFSWCVSRSHIGNVHVCYASQRIQVTDKQFCVHFGWFQKLP